MLGCMLARYDKPLPKLASRYRQPAGIDLRIHERMSTLLGSGSTIDRQWKAFDNGVLILREPTLSRS